MCYLLVSQGRASGSEWVAAKLTHSGMEVGSYYNGLCNGFSHNQEEELYGLDDSG